MNLNSLLSLYDTLKSDPTISIRRGNESPEGSSGYNGFNPNAYSFQDKRIDFISAIEAGNFPLAENLFKSIMGGK